MHICPSRWWQPRLQGASPTTPISGPWSCATSSPSPSCPRCPFLLGVLVGKLLRTLTVCRHFGQNDDRLGVHVIFLVNFCHTKPLRSRFKKRLRTSISIIILYFHLLKSGQENKGLVWLKLSQKVMNYRYGETRHIDVTSCQGATTGRHSRRQDHYYHTWPQPHTSTFFGTKYSLSWFWPLWYHRCVCASIEKVGPCLQQVQSRSGVADHPTASRASDSWVLWRNWHLCFTV